MAESKKSRQVKFIESNVVHFFSDEDKKEKHTVESRKLLSIARRARTVQPNQGKTKKADNFYKQLIKDYSLNRKVDSNPEEKEWKQILKEMIDKDDEKLIKEWLKNNKSKFVLDSEHTKNLGINTDFHDQYSNFAEIQINQILYSNNDENINEDIDSILEHSKELSLTMLEYDEFILKLNKQLAFYQVNDYTETFLQYYKDIELFKFDIYSDSRKEWHEIEETFVKHLNKKWKSGELDDETTVYLKELKTKYQYIQKELIKHEKSSLKGKKI